TLICNHPDGEAPDQPAFADIEAAAAAVGISAYYLPVIPGKLSADDALAMGELIGNSPGPVLAYCRTGTRSTTLWAMQQVITGADKAEVLQTALAAGYDLNQALAGVSAKPATTTELASEVVIIGGGAAGIAVAS